MFLFALFHASERTFLVAFANGNDEALAKLFEKYYGRLFETARYHLSAKSYAADLLQDVFLELIQQKEESRQKLKEVVYPIAYLSKVIQRRAYSHTKKREVNRANQKMSLQEDSFLDQFFHQLGKEDQRISFAKEYQDKLGEIIEQAKLTGKGKQYFYAYFIGHSIEEIAQAFITKKENVSATLYLARKKVRELEPEIRKYFES